MVSDALQRFYPVTAPVLAAKTEQSAEIAKQTAEFLAAGGEIQHCEIRTGEPLKRYSRGELIKHLARNHFNREQDRKAARKQKRTPGRDYGKSTPSARRWNGSENPQ
jgi:hypothetical protein